jgi:hypothetical protein
MSFVTEPLWTRAVEMGMTERTESEAAGVHPASDSTEYLRAVRHTGPPVSNIFITCPSTGIPVPTGLTTNAVVFHSLPPVAIPLCCAACGKMHKWKPQDAWIGQGLPSPICR